MARKKRIIEILRHRYPEKEYGRWEYTNKNCWRCEESDLCAEVVSCVVSAEQPFRSWIQVREFNGRDADGFPIWWPYEQIKLN